MNKRVDDVATECIIRGREAPGVNENWKKSLTICVLKEKWGSGIHGLGKGGCKYPWASRIILLLKF